MNALRIIFILSVFLISCNRTQKPKIEKFIWIRHNLNWIRDISELQTKYYLSFNDSSKTILFAHNSIKTKTIEYYKTLENDTLTDLIYKNFYKKSYLKCVMGQPSMYDGDIYCIIYKFENEPEHFITYIPNALSDSLKHFVDFVEKKALKPSNDKAQPFDVNFELKHYIKSIIECCPPVPPAETMEK